MKENKLRTIYKHNIKATYIHICIIMVKIIIIKVVIIMIFGRPNKLYRFSQKKK